MKARKNPRRNPAKATGIEIEVEVKVRIANHAALRRRLIRLRAKPQGARVREMNTLYDTPEGALMRTGHMLRIRVETPAGGAGKAKKAAPRNAARPNALLTYKGPVEPAVAGGASAGPAYKVREEREVRVRVAGSRRARSIQVAGSGRARGMTDADEVAAILEGIGLRPCFRYEKYRSTFHLPGLPGLKVELDETPIGDFVELEGNPRLIDRSAKLLGFGPADYITLSYGALFLEQAQKGSSGEGEGRLSTARDRGDMLFPRPK